MDLREYQQRIANLAANIQQQALDGAMVPAAGQLLARIKNRIINDGLNSSGAKIGDYSIKPRYFKRADFVQKGAFKPGGKSGFSGEKIVSTRQYRAVTMKNGRERLVSEKTYKVVKNKPKTMYLAQGYSELRGIQGRRNDTINLEYSGDTFLAYQLGKTPSAVQLGFTREKASKIRRGLEARFGKTYTATSAELTEYKTEVITQSALITRRLLTTT